MSLFERAQELASGNLSAAISRGVRRFVEIEEGLMEGQREITVAVGEAGMQRAKRFVGTRIVKWEHGPVKWEASVESRKVKGEPALESAEVFSVYQTAGGRLAVHLRRPATRRGAYLFTEWASMPEDPSEEWKEETEATLDIYEEVDQLVDHAPSELVNRVRHAISHPQIEVLDI